jgi:hypothetical protein
MASDNPQSTASERKDIQNSKVAQDDLQAKMHRLVGDFAAGNINRTQFHQLYDRYQRQITRLAEITADAEDLKLMSSEETESTFHIKKRLTAKVLGVSIYSNVSGMPIETIGEFVVDPALLIPMLSSYRAATREIFKAGMRSTAMENDQWLCFVPGNLTTLIALFSVEPAAMQLRTVEQMHRDFEAANLAALESGEVDPKTLAYPFLGFVKQAHTKGATDTGTYSTRETLGGQTGNTQDTTKH